MKRTMIALLICVFITGCWDQLQLKKLLFVDIIGIDYEGNSKQLKVDYVISALRESNQGAGRPTSLHMEATGSNLYDAVANTNKEIPGTLSVLETRLYLISSRFAKDEPLRHLDIASQFASNPLYAYLAVYDGDLSKLLDQKGMKDQTVSNYLIGLLDDEIRRGKIPSNKLLHYILGGDQFMNDFALNRFEPFKGDARLTGTALFSDGRYTGKNLNNEETQLATLMESPAGKNQLLSGQRNGKSYSVLVQSAKRHFHMVTDADKLREIEIALQLQLKLVEDGSEFKKHTDKMLQEMESAIAADLTTRITKVMAALQQANCDYLQLGHEVAVYHPSLFKYLDWREQYPSLSIKPKVTVKILNTAILE
ncbi:Ger(x)C family germination protein [Paenibacillus sp. BK033]|uniref:Ger(x)C family spore germination protein n=1 Tax=Paenibacillus sp. BK033 TaxID=2512133 RepID=UPI00104F8973|nr:Ger(x)C family spore germination protein [Paenibacillus sp. BK033]TCM96259.1 Ger(x)C family germination protein [Paenibacillus sp. BK033]